MTAFGDIFRAAALEGAEDDDGNGQRGRITGLDLEGGVVRVTPTGSAPRHAAPEDADDDGDAGDASA